MTRLDIPHRQLNGLHIPHRPLAGLPIAVSTMTDAARIIGEYARAGGAPADVHLVNAYTVALAETDPAFRACIENSTVNLPDGKPLSWLTRLTRARLHQVRGPSLFLRMMDSGRSLGLRHYLLGSTPETLEKLQRELETRFPGVQIVGSESPPFRPMDAAELDEQDRRILEREPHIVWVGLGTPKQDFEAKRVAVSCNRLTIAVGAAFDFVAGTKKEAPQWMSLVGLEWLFRLLTEPRRLWRRYLLGNLIFLLAVAKKRT
jgi:N-acetylglucosaminyldiphosphoundecaprenol N-acetyl-beta-D-mannosaminyltransferase